MKRTISITALTLSASASFALIGPPHVGFETQNYCVNVYYKADNSMEMGSCDQSYNNLSNSSAQIGENGCAAGQISVTTHKQAGAAEFPIKINACMPPNAVQL